MIVQGRGEVAGRKLGNDCRMLWCKWRAVGGVSINLCSVAEQAEKAASFECALAAG